MNLAYTHKKLLNGKENTYVGESCLGYCVAGTTGDCIGVHTCYNIIINYMGVQHCMFMASSMKWHTYVLSVAFKQHNFMSVIH